MYIVAVHAQRMLVRTKVMPHCHTLHMGHVGASKQPAGQPAITPQIVQTEQIITIV